MVLLVLAHPYLARSRANRALLEAVRDLDGLEVRALYDRYPDFDIDVEAEQRALTEASAVIWQHPMYWYSVPGLLKHWFDRVLARGWAYGGGAAALRGKRCLWAVTTGGDEQAFQPDGMHAHTFPSFVGPVEQTARFCGMIWEHPEVLYGAHQIPEAALAEAGQAYRRRVEGLLALEQADG